MERACPRSDLRSQPSLTHTGAWAWNLRRLPVSLKPCGACQGKLGVGQKQARPLDADALAAIRATAFTPRTTRGGSLEMEETALRRGRLDIALASVLSDAGTAHLGSHQSAVARGARCREWRWTGVHRAIEDRPGRRGSIRGDHARYAGGPEAVARGLRSPGPTMNSVFGLSMSQISRRVDSMARAAGLGEGYSGHSGRVGLAIRMTRRGAPLQAVQTHGRWKSPSMPARYTRSEKALEALEWLV